MSAQVQYANVCPETMVKRKITKWIKKVEKKRINVLGLVYMYIYIIM